MKRRGEIEVYDDPLGIDEDHCDLHEEYPATNLAAVVVTGLNEEEDAARYIAKQFDKTISFCANCEHYFRSNNDFVPYDGETDPPLHCPICYGILEPVGTKPTHSRRKHT